MPRFFFRLENQSDDYRATSLLLYLFVVMTEVVGGMQTSGGVGAGSVLYFPLAFVKSRASHVARFCFSESLWALRGLRAACPTTPGLVFSHVGRGVGQVLAFFFFFAGTTRSCLDVCDRIACVASFTWSKSKSRQIRSPHWQKYQVYQQNFFSCCPVFSTFSQFL